MSIISGLVCIFALEIQLANYILSVLPAKGLKLIF